MKTSSRVLGIAVLIAFLAGCSQMELSVLQNNLNNKYNLNTEAGLKNPAVLSKIDSLYDWGKEGYFDGVNDVKIYYKYFIHPNEKGAIVISSGRTEAAIKYKETIYDLYNNGYSVYILDHRGQGFSGRMIDDPEMGYVDKFENYVKDLKKFYDTIVTARPHKHIFLLAHSMGGAIGVTYLEEYPNDFEAAAFSSPMLGLSFPTCSFVEIFSGDEPEYAPGHGSYEENKETFEENTLTTSKTRFDLMLKVYEENPKAKLGGASYQWVCESCKQFDVIFDNLDKIKTPLILFSAENEEIVDPSDHRKFIDELVTEYKRDAKGYLVPGAKHELFIERDNVRIPVLTTILDFFNRYVKKGSMKAPKRLN